MSLHLDNNGLPVTANGDGGDTLANLSRACYPKFFRDVLDYRSLIAKLEVSENRYVRYTKDPYNDPNDTSRDQEIPMVICMGAHGLTERLARVYERRVSRLGRCENGDLITWDWVIYWRALGLFGWRSLLIPILDIGLLINTLIICFIKAREPGNIQRWLGKHVHWIFTNGAPPNHEGVPQDAYGMDNVGQDLNHFMSLHQALTVRPSYFSTLALIIYFKYRPGGALYPWLHYYRKETGNNPIYQAWVDTIEYVEDYLNVN